MTLTRRISVGVILFVLMCASGCIATNNDSIRPQQTELGNAVPKNILFVGNSYLYYNDSLHNHVKRIVAEKNPNLFKNIHYKSATIGGASLSHHYIDSLLEPGRLGLDEPFDLVILQGGSGEVLSARRREAFATEAADLNQKIRATGAHTALYMTHAYAKPHKKYDPAMIDIISKLYINSGNNIDALVIPVGLAFKRAYTLKPKIQLHKAFDGTHPSLLGTYLAACVVYASVYQDTTVGLKYDYFGKVSQKDALFLQTVADDTVDEFFKD